MNQQNRLMSRLNKWINYWDEAWPKRFSQNLVQKHKQLKSRRKETRYKKDRIGHCKICLIRHIYALHIHMYTYIYTYTARDEGSSYVSTYTDMYRSIRVYTYICVYIYTYICVHICNAHICFSRHTLPYNRSLYNRT